MADESLTERRKNGLKWLEDHLPGKTQVFSKDNAEKFTFLTSLTHTNLELNWKPKEFFPPGKRQGIITSCNSFAGEYSRNNVKIYLGGINPHADVIRLGRPYAWIDLASGKKPLPGDIVKSTGQHTFISIKIDDDGTWHTAEGGQGGPKFADKPVKGLNKDGVEVDVYTYLGGQDLVCRRDNRKWDPDTNAKSIEGWIDIDFMHVIVDPSPGDKTGSLWLNEDGDVVHPNAPQGAGGPGRFRMAGVLQPDKFNHAVPYALSVAHLESLERLRGNPHTDGLPHHWSPASRNTDPLDVLRWENKFDNDTATG